MTNTDLNKKMAEFMGWEDDVDRWDCPENDSIILKEYWNPADNISDAWMVVEKMWVKGFYCEVGQQNISGEFECSFLEKKSKGNYYSEIAKTAPKAICLAALKTLEGE